MITTTRPTAPSPWPRFVLAAAVAAFLVVFVDLLLTSGLPRVPLVDQGHLSTLGHVAGAFLVAWQLSLLLPDRRSPAAAVAAALALTVAFAVGIELVQELRPVRAYELGDAAADVAGAAAGALAGLLLAFRPVATRQRARLVLALVTIGCAAVGALVVAAADVIDRIPQ